MSLQDIILLWCSRVTPDVKALYPEINDAMELGKTALIAMKTVRTKLAEAKVIYKEYQDAQEIASASATFMTVAQVAAKAGITANEQLMQLAQDALSQATLKVSAKVECLNSNTQTQPKAQHPSEVEKTLQKAVDAMGLNLCSAAADLLP